MTFIELDRCFLQKLAMWTTLKNRTDVLLAEEHVAKKLPPSPIRHRGEERRYFGSES